MPKPFYTKLIAICAIGFFCLIFGSLYGFVTHDRLIGIMSILIGICSLIRFLLLLRLVRAGNYQTLTGICLKREPSFFKKTQHILFRSTEQKEYRFALEKNVKLLEGHYYRLYFRKADNRYAEYFSEQESFLGFEELTFLPEKNK